MRKEREVRLRAQPVGPFVIFEAPQLFVSKCWHLRHSSHEFLPPLPLSLSPSLSLGGIERLRFPVIALQGQWGDVSLMSPNFAKRSKISFSFTVKKIEQKEKRFMFPDSWANGSSFKIVASRVKVTFLPSILTLRLLFNRCHTAPLPSFSSPFQHVRLLWTWCLVPESDTDFRSSRWPWGASDVLLRKERA